VSRSREIAHPRELGQKLIVTRVTGCSIRKPRLLSRFRISIGQQEVR
jgi:hypothetical protein